MTEGELRSYLHEHIPLSRAMGVEVASLQEDGVVLQAPLAPNINHRETVFGGSASAVAILAGWSLVHTRLLRQGIGARVVIQNNTMRYDAPITGTFSARARLSDGADWARFIAMLGRKGRARIEVSVDVEFEGSSAGHLTGEFVAVK
jgi:thioesterase domain-containing protein